MWGLTQLAIQVGDHDDKPLEVEGTISEFDDGNTETRNLCIGG